MVKVPAPATFAASCSVSSRAPVRPKTRLFFSVAMDLSFLLCFLVKLQQPTPLLPGKAQSAGGAQALSDLRAAKTRGSLFWFWLC